MKKRTWLISVAGGVLLLASLACSLGDLQPGAGAGDQAAQLPSPTDTLPATPSEAPTSTTVPSQTPIPSATIKPTLRPSATFTTPTLRPTWTASPTLSPTTTPQVAPLLEEDFNDTEAPWMKKEGGNWKTGIARKAYFMTVLAPKVEITSARTWLKLAEVRIEAEIWQHTGSGYYGFNCRETVAGSYYTIFITTDGYYGFGEFRNEELNILRYMPLPEWDPPIDPKGPNLVRGDCRGNALTLYINGQAVDRITVTGHGSGYVGMMVGTRLEDEDVTIFFDNLKIWGPEK